MDDADRADHTAEQTLQAALDVRRADGPVPCGACHFCGETVARGVRFCDIDCRDDWERRQAQGSRTLSR